jgi:GTP-binding protein
MFKIAIIGRPNVGKSTFFNKLVGKKFSITDDEAGVTRDRKESIAKLGPLNFMAIDTAGLENEIKSESLQERMFIQTKYAIEDADLCLFIVDGKLGINNTDFYFAKWLHKINKKTILIANKCENLINPIYEKEYYKLGFGEPVAISAEHNIGFGELYDKIAPFIEEYNQNFFSNDKNNLEVSEQLNSDILDEEVTENICQIAIIGKPNAGKSSFLNKILNQDRLITGAEAGITRDTIAIDFNFKGKNIRFIDTAGIRKKTFINQKLEKLAITESFRAIRFAQIVILLIDANSLLDHQDLSLAGQVLKEGRVLIFGINKIDQIDGDKEIFLKKVRKQIQDLLPEISGSPIVGVSAKTGYNTEKIIEMSLEAYGQWTSYLNTSKLQEWIKEAFSFHAPNLYKGKSVKLKYITQIKKRPPTFAIFSNYPTAIKDDYLRYLNNSLRNYFNLNLTPIRLVLRKSDNPYANINNNKFSKETKK